MKNSRRKFIRQAALGTAGLSLSSLAFSAKSYRNIIGANDRVKVGIAGFADRSRHTLIPAFLHYSKEMNMEISAVSDIWNRRRDEADKYFTERGIKVRLARNNEEMYGWKEVDAVIVGTADFQHALHAIEAVKAGCDAYVEKPFAETMEDNRNAIKIIQNSNKIIQIGSQRRSGENYLAANDYIRSGKFGKITMVEMSWNVNQPGRWRRPHLTSTIKDTDTDWKRYLMNRPFEQWDPRKFIEYRLFWPYSSGIPGQWMCHQIDTIHWFTGYDYPRSVTANGGIYMWNDGRSNGDTLTAVFDYGPHDDISQGFQAVYSSRMHNSAGGVKELYYSNGGMLNLDTNLITAEGGLTENYAKEMGMQANLLGNYELPKINVETSSNTGGDPMTLAHMKNWMDCIRSRKKTNADEMAGYYHSIACIMTNAAIRTGAKATFNQKNQEVMVNNKPFKY